MGLRGGILGFHLHSDFWDFVVNGSSPKASRTHVVLQELMEYVEGALCFVKSHLAHIWGTCSKGYASSGGPLNITSTGFSHVHCMSCFVSFP